MWPWRGTTFKDWGRGRSWLGWMKKEHEDLNNYWPKKKLPDHLEHEDMQEQEMVLTVSHVHVEAVSFEQLQLQPVQADCLEKVGAQEQAVAQPAANIFLTDGPEGSTFQQQ